MVLAVRLGVVALLAAAGCSAAPPSQPQEAAPASAPAPTSTPAPAPPDRAEVGGLALSLTQTGGRCALDARGVTLPLDLAAPCRFLRSGAGGRPVTQDYPDKGSVVLVAGAPAPAASYPPNAGKAPADRCSDTGRAVFVRDGRASLGAVVREALAFCPDLAPDEKYYRQLASAAAEDR